MNDDESMLPSAGPEAEESPLKLLEDMLHNRMMQKKQEMQRPRTGPTQQTEYGQR
jgi:hypothetical protein